MVLTKTIRTFAVVATFACFLALYPSSSLAIDRGNTSYVPLFITIKTTWCHGCSVLDPIVGQVKLDYSGKVIFLELDASNDEAIYASQQIAQNHGVQEFFDTHRNAFPRVSIYCPGGLSPREDLLGARQPHIYREILDNILVNGEQICSVNGRPPSPATDVRPEEPKVVETVYGRPDEPVNVLDRPIEIAGSGRPQELKFWSYGTPIPLNFYLYSRALTLPSCEGGNQILCYNGGKQEPSSSDSGPAFKPYDSNATRNEKGFSEVKVN